MATERSRRRGSVLKPRSMENLPPPSPYPKEGKELQISLQRSAVSEKIAAIRDRWSENSHDYKSTESTVKSPTLIQLQKENQASAKKEKKVAGNMVQSKQRELERLHHEAKSRVEAVGGVGGGVSLWPAMDDMRLSKSDAIQLIFFCLFLVLSTSALFFILHGTELGQLWKHHLALEQFSTTHTIHTDRGQDIFNHDLLNWHSGLLSLQVAIENDFNVVWTETSSLYLFSILLYIGGVGVLLYFLAENVLSKSRLTPRRIRTWVSLMCVVGVWTVLSFHLLMSAQKLEREMEENVHLLTNQLAGLVSSGLDLTQYRDVLLYWQTRYLLPQSHGLVWVLGVVPVRDVSFYLHYYSLPILTALCTPLVKLIISLRAVYNI